TAVILNELATKVPLVQVANTTAGELEIGGSFPQQIVAPTLYLPDATWFKEVTKLIALAEQIVVWARELTPALNQELTALRVRDRTADTTVILEEESRDPFFMDLFIERSPIAHNHELLTAGHPALAEFPHVISAKRFAGKQVRECPELMGLVERL